MDYTPALPDSGYGTPIPPQPIHVPPIKAKPPFLSLQHRPKADDGLFHVLLVSSGSRASCQVPDIIGALSKDPQIALQIVATDRSLRYYNQEAVDAAVRHAWNLAPEASNEFGVTIWTDADDQGRTNLADPVLHMELHKWADIVVVAPCSADMLAKMVQGLSGNLALEITRSLAEQTPLIICPSVSTPMFRNQFTKKHLKAAVEDLGAVVLGPQARGRLECGDEGEGVMTDWRDIVIAIQDFSSMYRMRMLQKEAEEAEKRSGAGTTAVERRQAEFDVDSVFGQPGVSQSTSPQANGVPLNWARAGFPAKDIMQHMFHQPGLPSTREPGSRLTGARLTSISDQLRADIGQPPRPPDEDDKLDWPKLPVLHGSPFPPLSQSTSTNPPPDQPSAGGEKADGVKEFFHDRGLRAPRQGTFERGPDSAEICLEPLRLGPMEHWKAMGQGSYWQTRWWAG